MPDPDTRIVFNEADYQCMLKAAAESPGSAAYRVLMGSTTQPILGKGLSEPMFYVVICSLTNAVVLQALADRSCPDATKVIRIAIAEVRKKMDEAAT